MARAVSARGWHGVHRWSSLVCTAFLLLACLTGLPLIFEEEIRHWLDDDPPYAVLPADTPMADLDQIVRDSLRRHPGQIVTSISLDDDAPQVVIAMAPSWDALADAPGLRHFLRFDARTGQHLARAKPLGSQKPTVMGVLLKLHMNLLAGQAGALLLGGMGLLFVVSIVSGAVLYGPFMQKLDFGTVRIARAPRLKWLDLHNLLGIVTLAWALVVGITGALNTIALPLFTVWQQTEVQAMLQPWRGQAPPQPDELGSVQAAFDTARRALPGMRVVSIAYPGGRFGSPHHYLIWSKGDTPLTSRLFSPTLVDARTGELTAVVNMPWYLRALEVSRPLHFGDYGGLPLKLLWAALDLITVLVLGSGLYLWYLRRCAS